MFVYLLWIPISFPKQVYYVYMYLKVVQSSEKKMFLLLDKIV